jgi:hypothetical protein
LPCDLVAVLCMQSVAPINMCLQCHSCSNDNLAYLNKMGEMLGDASIFAPVVKAAGVGVV